MYITVHVKVDKNGACAGQNLISPAPLRHLVSSALSRSASERARQQLSHDLLGAFPAAVATTTAPADG